MTGFNQVIVTGKVRTSPELHYDRAHVAHTAIQLACVDAYQNAQGDWLEEEQIFAVAFQGDAAEQLHQLVQKGDVVLIEGRLKMKAKQLMIAGKGARVLAKATLPASANWPEAAEGVAKLDVWGNLTQQQPEH